MIELGIAAPLAAALTAKGYETLTAVQLAVIAPEASGRDLLVSAQTGSGKTAVSYTHLPFYPFGSYDPIEMLRLASLVAHLTPADWLHAITTTPAAAMGLPAPRIAVGEPADFITIEGADWTEALCSARTPRHIHRANGKATP